MIQELAVTAARCWSSRLVMIKLKIRNVIRDKAVGFLIYNLESSSSASNLQAVPSEFIQHVRDTGVAAIIIKDESGSTSLDFFKSLLVSLVEGIPYGVAIFQ